MRYTGSEKDRIEVIKQEIERRKAEQEMFLVPTYKDVPLLDELDITVELHDDTDEDTLGTNIDLLRYLSECYDSMGRRGVALKYQYRLLEADKLMTAEHPEFYSSADKANDRDSDVYTALSWLCSFSVEDRGEVYSLAESYIPRERFDKMAATAEERTVIRRDPVEMTDEYIRLLDGMNEYIEKEKKTSIPQESWMLAKEYLSGHGVEWHDPQEINGGFWD